MRSTDSVVTRAASTTGSAANGASLVCTGEPLTAAAIFGPRPLPAPWPASSRALLAQVAVLLPTIEDDRTAHLLEHLALAIISRVEALDATRALLSVALTTTHRQDGARA